MSPTAKRRTAWIVVGLLVVIGIPVASTLISNAKDAAVEAASGSVPITLSGQLGGDNYQIDSDAKLSYSEADQRATIDVFVARTSDDGGNMTPLVTATLPDGTQCETFRSWTWSTEAGSSIRLDCDGFLDLADIQAMSTATVTSL